MSAMKPCGRRDWLRHSNWGSTFSSWPGITSTRNKQTTLPLVTTSES